MLKDQYSGDQKICKLVSVEIWINLILETNFFFNLLFEEEIF